MNAFDATDGNDTSCNNNATTSNDVSDEEQKQNHNNSDGDDDLKRQQPYWSWSIDRLIEEQKWDDLLKRLNTSRGKEEVRLRNYSLLRYCLFNTNNIPDVITLTLLKVCPEEAKQVDPQNGDIPLFLACRTLQQQQQFNITLSLEVIKALIDAFPESVQRRDIIGRTPLFRACLAGASFEVVHLLLEAWPEGARTRSMPQGSFPIHAIFNREEGTNSLEVIKALLKEFPEGSKYCSLKGRYLPLHLACSQTNVSVDVIKTLVNAYPNGTFNVGASKHLPLHLACLNGCSYDVIHFLLEQYPKGISRPTIGDNLPLHLSCKAGHKSSVEVHNLLLQRFPEGAKMFNKRKNLPIHIAHEQATISSGSVFSCHVEKIRSLLTYYPEGALQHDEYGNLPINTVCLKPISTEVLDEILQAYPEGARHFNDHGELPLHSVCLWDKSNDDHDDDESNFLILKLGAIQALVEAYKEGLTMTGKHRRGAIPLKIILVQAKKLKDRTSKHFQNYQRIIEYLVQQTYHSHELMDHDTTPFPMLHCAVRAGAPSDIIKDLCTLFPMQLHTKDVVKGRFPLHFAFNDVEVGQTKKEILHKFHIALYLIRAYPHASDKEDPQKHGLIPFVAASLMASQLDLCNCSCRDGISKQQASGTTITEHTTDSSHNENREKNDKKQIITNGKCCSTIKKKDDIVVAETLFVLLRYNPCSVIVDCTS